MSSQTQTENKINILLQNMRELNEVSDKLLNEMNRKKKIMEASLNTCQKCNAFTGGSLTCGSIAGGAKRKKKKSHHRRHDELMN